MIGTGNCAYGNDNVHLSADCETHVRTDDDGDVYIECGKYPRQFLVVCTLAVALDIATQIRNIDHALGHPGENGEESTEPAQVKAVK